MRDAGSLNCSSDIDSCPASSSGIWRTLLDAADFGDDARLVAVGGQAVLVAVEDDSFSIVRLGKSDDPDIDPRYSVSKFPGGDQQPFAIAQTESPDGEVFVATCDTAGTRCSVWRSADAGAAWTESQLPDGIAVHGIATDRAFKPARICAYGDGMWCEADGWQEILPATGGLQLNAVAMDYRLSVAAGDHGRWFMRAQQGFGFPTQWREQPRLGDATLTQAAVTESSGVIVGEGRIQAAFGSLTAPLACDVPADDVAGVLPSFGSPNSALALMQGGKLFSRSGWLSAEHYCVYQQLELPSRILDISTQLCGASLNPRALTERMLVGPPYTCPEGP
jgi:hypothetical protein